MRFLVTSTLLVSSVLFITGCDEESTPTGNYFPMAVGNSWTYHHIATQDGEVTTDETVEFIVTSHETMPDGSDWWGMSDRQFKTYQGTVFMKSDGGNWLFLLSNDQNIGDTSQRGFFSQAGTIFVVREQFAEYSVAAGDFGSVRAYAYHDEGRSSDQTNYSGADYYADGVGLIYHYEAGIFDPSALFIPPYDFTDSYELVSYSLSE